MLLQIGKIPPPQRPGQPPINDPRVRMLAEVLQDGEWSGQRCLVVGGGESLKGFDYSRLAGELVIGINRAIEVVDPDILFGMDRQFFDWVKKGEYDRRDPGCEALAKWNASRAIKVWAPNNPSAEHPDVYHVPCAHGYFGASIATGITCGDNSGIGAISLAIALGCQEVYLLGFDLHTGTPEKRHWHSGHPDGQTSAVYRGMLEMFKHYAPDMTARARIVNLNPDSALRCFEFGDLGQIPPRVRGYQVISFFTKDTGYEEEIKNLERSLQQLRIPYHFFGYPETGSWRGNLNYKSQCILEAMDMFPDKDIVFLDSDAIVRRDPVLFDQLSRSHAYDLSAHFYQYSDKSGGALELLSGTLWIANNETCRTLVRRWHEIGLKRDDVKHQQCLRLAKRELIAEGLAIRVNRHPFAYTCIFDYPAARQCVPVIEHFQASRRLRHKVGYGKNLRTGIEGSA